MEENNIILLKTRGEFEEYIKKNKYCIVYISAKWCGPCKRIKPLVNKCFSKLTDVKMILVDADESIDLYSKLKVKKMPTFYTFINGEMQDAQIGSDELGISNLFLKIAKTVLINKNMEFNSLEIL